MDLKHLDFILTKEEKRDNEKVCIYTPNTDLSPCVVQIDTEGGKFNPYVYIPDTVIQYVGSTYSLQGAIDLILPHLKKYFYELNWEFNPNEKAYYGKPNNRNALASNVQYKIIPFDSWFVFGDLPNKSRLCYQRDTLKMAQASCQLNFETRVKSGEFNQPLENDESGFRFEPGDWVDALNGWVISAFASRQGDPFYVIECAERGSLTIYNEKHLSYWADA